MKKLVVLSLILSLIIASMYIFDAVRDYQQLHDNIIRLHVVANSDDAEDQEEKLLVRDGILRYLQSHISTCNDVNEAYSVIKSQIPQIQNAANSVLSTVNSNHRAVVTLCEESFDTRHYDTFSLPSGIYSSLRVKLGDGEGRNWWCVVFPSLCIPADREGLEDTAAAAGFDEVICRTITKEEGFEIRFYVLDLIGRIENLFKKQ